MFEILLRDFEDLYSHKVYDLFEQKYGDDLEPDLCSEGWYQHVHATFTHMIKLPYTDWQKYFKESASEVVEDLYNDLMHEEDNGN